MAKRMVRAKLEVSILIELDVNDDVDEFLSEMDYQFVSNAEFPNSEIIDTEIRDWEVKDEN